MDAGLVARLDAARRFGQGLLYARQWLYASFDMALTGPTPGPRWTCGSAWRRATLLGHVPGTAFPGTFAHIVGGYAAGYYGYMWAEVIALDMLSAFGDDVMNPEVGRRFRRDILSRGGEEPAAVLVERFLGRPVERRRVLQGNRRRPRLTFVTLVMRLTGRHCHLTQAAAADESDVEVPADMASLKLRSVASLTGHASLRNVEALTRRHASTSRPAR